MAIDVIVHALWRNLTNEQPSFAGLPLVGQFTDYDGRRGCFLEQQTLTGAVQL